MIKLVDILLEQSNDKIDISALNLVDDELKKVLQAAAKEKPTNEELVSIGLFLYALPGIVKFLTSLIEKIAKKNGIDLTKRKNPAWFTILKEIAEKIDNYLDTPVHAVLKPFIPDNDKRNKVVKVIKAVIIVLGGSVQAFDANNIEVLSSTVKDLAPEISGDLMQVIVEKNPDTVQRIINILKQYFSK